MFFDVGGTPDPAAAIDIFFRVGHLKLGGTSEVESLFA
jgi:hypothetical protein